MAYHYNLRNRRDIRSSGVTADDPGCERGELGLLIGRGSPQIVAVLRKSADHTRLINGATAGCDFASINRDLHLGLCGHRGGTDSAQLNEPRAGFRTELSGWTESLFSLK